MRGFRALDDSCCFTFACPSLEAVCMARLAPKPPRIFGEVSQVRSICRIRRRPSECVGVRGLFDANFLFRQPAARVLAIDGATGDSGSNPNNGSSGAEG